MSKNKIQPTINSNCDNFLHTSINEKQVRRIQPDKFTFLKSNLLVANIVNRNISKSKNNISMQINEPLDAYINCQVEMNKIEEERSIKTAKIQRVKNLAKCRSQITFDQMQASQKSNNDIINNVYLLKKQMAQKASEIMGKKEDNAYLGRNFFNQGQKFLKQMKQANPRQKTQKNQTTRLLMKESAKKCHRKQYKQLLQESLISNTSKQSSISNINSSFQVSLLDVSQMKTMDQKVHNDNVLKKLMKNKSHEQFMQQQKRRAVWEGFSQHWRKGGDKNEQKIKQIKKKASKKIARPRFQTFDHQILQYNDQFTRHMALKKYENAFAQTAASFQLKIS